ncbi:MAG: hypothetical protein E7199_08885 [Schwartzia succinivorans]|nr:hypothetical protein [Schwartzia succinivorans]
MPVKVGNSYVTEAALAFAQKSAAESVDKEKTKGKGANGVLADLAEKFPKLKFTVGTQPFSGSGKGNVAISPKILREMEKDPAKREEYEALLYDVQQCTEEMSMTRPNGNKLKAHGWIIHEDGGLSAWSIGVSEGGGRKPEASGRVGRSSKKAWWQELLDEVKEKKKAKDKKAKKEKIGEAEKPKSLTETLKAEQEEAARILKANAEKIVSLPNQGNPALAKAYLAGQKDAVKVQSFSNTNELMKYLQDQFNVVRQGMTSISSTHLKACLGDEEKRAKLLDNLRVADEMLEENRGKIGFQSMEVKIDEDGEMTTITSGGRVGFNGEKRARQIAAAQTQGDLETVMRLLQVDLEQIEAGLKQNMCDEAEVQKVKDMIAQAEQRKSELGDTSDKENDPAAKAAFAVNMLI